MTRSSKPPSPPRARPQERARPAPAAEIVSRFLGTLARLERAGPSGRQQLKDDR